MENLLYEYFRDKDEKITISHSFAMAVQPNFHRNVDVLYILSGSVSTKVGDEQFTAEEGDIIFVHNYSVHAFNNIHTKYFLIPMPYYALILTKSFPKAHSLLTFRIWNSTKLSFLYLRKSIMNSTLCPPL